MKIVYINISDIEYNSTNIYFGYSYDSHEIFLEKKNWFSNTTFMTIYNFVQ